MRGKKRRKNWFPRSQEWQICIKMRCKRLTWLVLASEDLMNVICGFKSILKINIMRNQNTRQEMCKSLKETIYAYTTTYGNFKITKPGTCPSHFWITGPILAIYGMSAFYEAHFLKKGAFSLLTPPIQTPYLTISNENIFTQNSRQQSICDSYTQ